MGGSEIYGLRWFSTRNRVTDSSTDDVGYLKMRTLYVMPYARFLHGAVNAGRLRSLRSGAVDVWHRRHAATTPDCSCLEVRRRRWRRHNYGVLHMRIPGRLNRRYRELVHGRLGKALRWRSLRWGSVRAEPRARQVRFEKTVWARSADAPKATEMVQRQWTGPHHSRPQLP
jgi:hypothetical protein